MRRLQETERLPFAEILIRNARRVPFGRVTTYGRLARSAGGGAQAARSVTAILGSAYDRGVTDIPFHRIVYADGRVWMDERHEKERLRRYKEEGIELGKDGRIIDFREKLFDF